MRVLHLSASYLTGGAGIAAGRLHHALREAGVDSRMLVQHAPTPGPGVSVVPASPVTRYRPRLDRALTLLGAGGRPSATFSAGAVPRPLRAALAAHDPDVVHLHWLGGGFVGLESLAFLGRPVVWTTHDLWPITGGCHYPADGCEAYRRRCGRCPLLPRRGRLDASRWHWLRRDLAFRRLAPTFIAPSRWAADRIRESALGRRREVAVVANPLDTRRFHPGDPTLARRELGLPERGPLLLYGAVGATTDPRKGYDLLQAALGQLGRDAAGEPVTVCVFGNGDGARVARLPSGHAAHYVGRIADAAGLARLYSAADVMAVPSRAETFGQTASESLACGTPVVAFDATGLRDIVAHRQGGYLARPYAPADLAAGIAWVLSPERDRAAQRAMARARAVALFSGPVVAAAAREVYASALSGRASHR